MTGNTQELDEIFTKYTKQVIDMCHGNRPDVADESAKAKQAILDWHNKQIEEVLDRLLVASNYTDRQFSENPQLCLGKRDVQLAIEAERNKLKEQTNDQL